MAHKEVLKQIIVTLMLTYISIFFISEMNVEAVDPLPQPLSPPAGTMAIPGKDSITIKWSEPETGYVTATGFSIYRSVDGVDFQLLVSVNREVFSHMDSDIIIGRVYYYYLRTDSDIIQSENGPVVSSSADSTVPVVEIHTPSSGFVSGVDRVTISWRAEDSGSGIERVEITLDDDEGMDATGHTKFSFENLDEGEHEVVLTGYDLAGNGKEDSVVFIVDLTPPEVELTEPRQGEIFSEDQVRLKWDAMDEISEIISISLSVDESYTVDVTGNDAYTINNLEDGMHEAVLSYSDRGGHESIIHSKFTVDLEAPELFILSPEEESYISSDSVEVVWNGHDSTTPVDYRIRRTGKNWIEKWNQTDHTFSDLEEGRYEIEIEAEDRAGWRKYLSFIFTVDTSGPEISIPMENGPLRSYRGRLEIEWEVRDANGGPFTMEWSLNGGSWREAERQDRLILRGLDDGLHEIKIRTFDKAGNPGEIIVPTIWDSVEPEMIRYTPNGTLERKPQEIEVFFSEEMLHYSIHVSGDYLDGYVSVSGSTAIITISGEMEYGRTYQFTIWGEDLNGNILEGKKLMFHLTNMVTISGRVIDSEGRGLGGVSVILDSGRATVTEKNGSYRITERFGEVSIFFTLDGFEKEEVSMKTVPGRKNWAGTIKLKAREENETDGVLSWFNEPVSLVITALLIVSLIISSAFFWRYMDRERYTEVDIEMEEDSS
jgi:hypothetical protein